MLNLNAWNLLFTVCNVLIMFILMKKFLFQPVLNVIEKRQEMIDQHISAARDQEENANQLKIEYEKKLSEAKEEARSIVHSAKEESEKERQSILKMTQTETDEMIQKAKKDIISEQERAKKEAESEIAQLALIAARKILETGDAYDTDSH